MTVNQKMKYGYEVYIECVCVDTYYVCNMEREKKRIYTGSLCNLMFNCSIVFQFL